jgi:hypothetical protein
VVETAVSIGGIRPRLVVVWGLLLLLVIAIAAIEIKDRAQSSTAETEQVRDPRMLLPVSVSELGAVEIAHNGTLHRFERDAGGVWFYHGVHTPAQGAHGHQADPAVAKRIDSAFTALGRAHLERQFPLDRGVKEYGLTTPQLVILLYRPKQTQPLAQFAVGDVAPDTYSRYIMTVGRASVGTIPNYQIENLLGLIKEMSSGGAPAANPKSS